MKDEERASNPALQKGAEHIHPSSFRLHPSGLAGAHCGRESPKCKSRHQSRWIAISEHDGKRNAGSAHSYRPNAAKSATSGGFVFHVARRSTSA
jgi:hypothetical protein